MKNLFIFTLLLVLLGIMGCTKTVDIEAEKANVLKAMEMTVEAEKRRDVDATVKFFTDDVIVQPSDMPQIQGTQALRELYTGFFKIPFIKFDSKSTETIVAPSGNMAYNIGWNLMVFEGPDGNIEVKGKYLAIMKKIKSEWKIAVLAASNDQPAK